MMSLSKESGEGMFARGGGIMQAMYVCLRQALTLLCGHALATLG